MTRPPLQVPVSIERIGLAWKDLVVFSPASPIWQRLLRREEEAEASRSRVGFKFETAGVETLVGLVLRPKRHGVRKETGAPLVAVDELGIRFPGVATAIASPCDAWGSAEVGRDQVDGVEFQAILRATAIRALEVMRVAFLAREAGVEFNNEVVRVFGGRDQDQVRDLRVEAPAPKKWADLVVAPPIGGDRDPLAYTSARTTTDILSTTLGGPGPVYLGRVNPVRLGVADA